MSLIKALEISLRRAIADGSYDEAERIAAEIARILGEPAEDSRGPDA